MIGQEPDARARDGGGLRDAGVGGLPMVARVVMVANTVRAAMAARAPSGLQMFLQEV